MRVRFWGTRGSIPTPGHRTAIYGGNTSCVEIRTNDDTLIVFDCGTGIRELGQHLLDSKSVPKRIHLLIGHTHWDHIQGFPFFTPVFLPGTELNIYAPSGFQRSLEESLSGQMQYVYFPVRLNELASHIHFTELEEGFFRIGDVLVETQYLNHTAPTIAYRLSDGESVFVYATDHEPFLNGPDFRHPGDQRHIAFLRGADLVVHDAQYTDEEYRTKLGWGHSTVEYATNIAIAAGVSRLALSHHDPTHSDMTIRQLEDIARGRAEAAGSPLAVFAAAEGMELEISGRGAAPMTVAVSALIGRPIAGSRVLIVSDDQSGILSIGEIFAEDGLILTPTPDGRSAVERAASLMPDMIIMDARLSDGPAVDFIQPLRNLLKNPELPILLLTDQESHDLYDAAGAATDYLAKPFSPPMLRTRVLAWLVRTLGSLRAAVTDEVTPPVRPAEPANVDLLASFPLFRKLQRPELEKLLANAKEGVFLTGQPVVRQGEPGNSVYVILSGRVQVVEALPDTPVEIFLGELGQGEVFGELAILLSRPRSATVLPLERTRCLIFQDSDFITAVKTSSEMSMDLLRVLAARLYETDKILARHAPDPLTGLPGRRTFHDLYRPLTAAVKRRKAGVVLLALDVVNLKRINDNFGRKVGDEVLRSVADALTGSSRTTDLIVRYGSDEFAALLVDATEKDAAPFVSRVQLKLREVAANRGLPVQVQCNVGIAASENPPDVPDELLRAADRDIQIKRRGQAGGAW